MSTHDYINQTDTGGLFQGQQGMAVVVDVNDPDELGRVRCRIIGLQDEGRVPDDKLPWIHCSYNNEPSNRGVGHQPPNYAVGSKVMLTSMGQQGYVVSASMPNVDPNIEKADIAEDVKKNTPREFFLRNKNNKKILEQVLEKTGTKDAYALMNGEFSTNWTKTSDDAYYTPPIQEGQIPDHYKKRKKSRSQDKLSIGVEQFAGEIQNAQKFILGKIGEQGSLIPKALQMIDNLYKIKDPLSTPRPTDILPGNNLLSALQGIAAFFNQNKNNDKEEEQLVCENIENLEDRKKCRERQCYLLPTQEEIDACVLRAQELYEQEKAQQELIDSIDTTVIETNVFDEPIVVINDPGPPEIIDVDPDPFAEGYTVNALFFGPLGDDYATPEENTATLQAAYNAVKDLNGAVIRLPAYTITLTTPTLTRVNEGEGACVRMLSGGNVVWLGAGNKTIIKGTTNKLELFTQLNAVNIEFNGITFDATDVGLLQYQLTGTGALENGGIVRHGNSAHCAIRQYKGAGLTVKNCIFKYFNVCINYLGDYLDNSVLSGTVIVQNNRYENFIQGLLAHQPEHISATDWIEISNRQSLNGYNTGGSQANTTVASNDPGHGLYVTDRTGAAPKTVIVSNVQGEDGEGSAVRVRKGYSVSITNIALKDYTRLVNVENASHLTLSNISGSMRAPVQVADTNTKGLEIVDVENWEADNIVVDMRGTNSFGFYAQSSVDGATDNRRGRLKGFSAIHDFSTTGKAVISLVNQIDTYVDSPLLHHEGTTVNTRGMVRLTTCERVHVINPSKTTQDGADDTYLVQIDNDCVNCVVSWRTMDLDQVPNTTTIVDSGTSTSVYRDGMRVLPTFLPVVSFDTNNDWNPTYTRQQCEYFTIGNMVYVQMFLQFTSNTLTSPPTGNMKISAPLYAASGLDQWSGTMHQFYNFDLGSTTRTVAPFINEDENVIYIRQIQDDSAGGTTGAAAVTSSELYIIALSIWYKIAE